MVQHTEVKSAVSCQVEKTVVAGLNVHNTLIYKYLLLTNVDTTDLSHIKPA